MQQGNLLLDDGKSLKGYISEGDNTHLRLLHLYLIDKNKSKIQN